MSSVGKLRVRVPELNQRVERSYVLTSTLDLAKETHSARVAEVDSDSDVKFQDLREALPTRSLADSIAAPKIPQVATTQETSATTIHKIHDITVEQSESMVSPRKHHRFSVQKMALNASHTG